MNEIKVNKPLSLIIGNKFEIQFLNGDWHVGEYLGQNPLTKSLKFKTEYGKYNIYSGEEYSKIREITSTNEIKINNPTEKRSLTYGDAVTLGKMKDEIKSHILEKYNTRLKGKDIGKTHIKTLERIARKANDGVLQKLINTYKNFKFQFKSGIDEVKRLQQLAGITEIKVNKPIQQSEHKNIDKLRGFIIERIKEIISEDIDNAVDYLLENENVLKYIINDMISNNYEIVRNGEEILLSHSNINLLNEKDIQNYLQNNKELEGYFKSLITEFYFDYIDINSIYKKAENKLKQQELEDDEEITDWDLEYIAKDETIDNEEGIYLEDITWGNPEFNDFINSKLIRI